MEYIKFGYACFFALSLIAQIIESGEEAEPAVSIILAILFFTPLIAILLTNN